MTRDDVLRLLLIAADDVHRVFDHTETSDWPPGALQEFERAGLLRPASGVLIAPCPNCPDAHLEPVQVRVDQNGQRRWFVWCPEALRVQVSLESCQGWQVNPDGLTAAIAAAMNLKGSPKPAVPDRLWRLGRLPWRGKTREVVFARRLADPDASAIVAHIGPSGRSIVLVPHAVPDDRLWPGRTPAVVALSQIATYSDQGLALDGVALIEAIESADALAEARSLLPTDPEVKKQVVRRHINAELDRKLDDDVLVAAYKQHGSFRSAAAALTKDLERKIGKDKVRRAVQRRGGIKAVANPEDSSSVRRRVASRRRDRTKKI